MKRHVLKPLNIQATMSEFWHAHFSTSRSQQPHCVICTSMHENNNETTSDQTCMLTSGHVAKVLFVGTDLL